MWFSFMFHNHSEVSVALVLNPSKEKKVLIYLASESSKPHYKSQSGREN